MKKILLICENFNKGGSGKLSKILHDTFSKSENFEIISIHDSGRKLNEKNIYSYSNKLSFLFIIKIFFRFFRYIFSTNQHYFFNKFLINFSFFKTDKIAKILNNFKPDIILISGFEYVLSFKEILNLKEKFNSQIIIYPIDNFYFTGGCRYSLNCPNFSNLCKNCYALKDSYKYMAELNLIKNIKYIKKIDPIFLLPSEYSKNFYLKSSVYKETNCKYFCLTYPMGNFFEKIGKNEISEIKKKFNINESKRVILIGTQNFYEWRKGMYNLKSFFDIFQHRDFSGYEKCEFLIVGKNSKKVFFVDKKNFHYFDELDYDEISLLYKISDIFIIPSYQEWSSLMMTEAIAHGKILLAFNAGSSADLIENNINGYIVEKYNNEDFMNKFENVINFDDQKFESFKDNSKKIYYKNVEQKIFLENFNKIIGHI